ncbi:nucleotidyltransferase family protein [Aerosakkonemataceae cyanobacterium BLCC-F154]|uniref:Nucleotidyltransferase family protein n=1 Tax=Floridaenema fluviatile BLCC-F154 TaxID=3153640 RepID=A0ABV4YE89_9CYAN
MVNLNVLTSKDLAGVTATILAGGLGTRLRSVVVDRPKTLAKIGDRPFLTYLLEKLAATEIKNVVLCIGYLGEQIETIFGNSYKSLNLFYSQETSPLGTGGALRLALPLVKSDSILVMNGDSFCDASLSDFFSDYCQQKAEVSLLLTQVSDTSRYGQVKLDTNGKLISFAEKANSSGSGWINAGIYLIKRQKVQEIPENRFVSLEKEMFPTWIESGIYGYQASGRFIDIGTPESYAQAENFFAAHKSE